MKFKNKASYYLKKLVYYIGWATIFILALILVLAGYIKLDRAISRQNLDHGYVTAKCYDDGHYWYSSWVFGDYSITKRNGGAPYLYIKVEDGDKSDFWTVSEDEWDKLTVGDYIAR